MGRDRRRGGRPRRPGGLDSRARLALNCAIRFAYSTNAYTERPLETALEDIAAAGFSGVEILCDAPHAVPGRVDAAEIGDALKRLKLDVSNLNVNTAAGSFAAPVEYVTEALKLAKRWGSRSISIAPGGADMDRSIRSMLDAAADVRIGIEFEPGLEIGCCDDLVKVLGRVKDPRLGANLDLGHVVCAGERIEETVARLAGRIWNVHVEDIRGGVHDHLIPGEGDVDFAAAFKALERAGYDGFLTLELYPYKKNPGEAGRRGLAHLKKVLERRLVR